MESDFHHLHSSGRGLLEIWIWKQQLGEITEIHCLSYHLHISDKMHQQTVWKGCHYWVYCYVSRIRMTVLILAKIFNIQWLQIKGIPLIFINQFQVKQECIHKCDHNCEQKCSKFCLWPKASTSRLPSFLATRCRYGMVQLLKLCARSSNGSMHHVVNVEVWPTLAM